MVYKKIFYYIHGFLNMTFHNAEPLPKNCSTLFKLHLNAFYLLNISVKPRPQNAHHWHTISMCRQLSSVTSSTFYASSSYTFPYRYSGHSSINRAPAGPSRQSEWTAKWYVTGLLGVERLLKVMVLL